MDTGDWLTRIAIWLALTLYVAAEIAGAIRRGGKLARTARVLDTIGCAAFLTHVAFAFHFHHQWSHEAAYADTARQTAAYFGWDWGGGLYFNYAFLALWLGRAICSWIVPGRFPKRNGWGVWAMRGFILIMIVNGAVIFASEPFRWFGLILCLILLWCWWPRAGVNDHK